MSNENNYSYLPMLRAAIFKNYKIQMWEGRGTLFIYIMQFAILEKMDIGQLVSLALYLVINLKIYAIRLGVIMVYD